MDVVHCPTVDGDGEGEGYELIAGPCRCTYIDVGLNNGRSLDQILNSSESATFTRPPKDWKAKVHNRWQECIAEGFDCWYGFEGNPSFTRELRRWERKLVFNVGRRAKLYTKTLFAISAGTTSFYIDNLTAGVGSTIRADNNWVRRREGKFKVGPETVSTVYRRITVPTVAAGPFLQRVRRRSAFVFLKIDVEGYEFDLISHLLRNEGLCGCVDVIAVDWHERTVGKAGTEGKNAGTLSSILKRDACNVATLPWG